MKLRTVTLVALAACAAASFADTIKLKGTGNGLTVKIVYKGNAFSGFGGQLEFKNLDKNSVFTSYCVDLDNIVSVGQTWDVKTAMTKNDPIFSLAGSVLSNGAGKDTSDNKAASLQIAVWAARYGTDLKQNKGQFKLDSSWYDSHAAVINDAISMLDAGKNNKMDAMLWIPQDNCGGQAQLTPVPEPASMIALGLGIVGLARRRRK